MRFRLTLTCLTSELYLRTTQFTSLFLQMSQLRYNFQTGQYEPLPEYLQTPAYDQDFDDYYTAEDYDRRAAERDGWTSSVWDGR